MVKPLPRAAGIWIWLVPIVSASLLLLALDLLNNFSFAPAGERSDAEIRHTLEVIAAARRFDEAVQQAERNQRGYVITGDPAYLAAYREAAAKAPPDLAALRELTADNGTQQERTDRLRQLLDRQLRSLAESAEIRRVSGFEAARDAIVARHPIPEMREFSALIRSILADEDRLLLERQAHAGALQREARAQSAVAAVLAAGILLLGGIPLLIHRLRGAEATLHESEERFRLLVGSIRDYAIFMLDADGRIVTWNEGARILTGYDAAEIVGRHAAVLFAPEDVATGDVERDLRVVLADQRQTEAEGWRVRKDGTRFWANAVRSAIRDQDGRSIGVAVVLRDMTERHRQQEALERRRAALEQAQKMEALGQLTGGVAHDFNNLLTVILNSIEVLEVRVGGAGAEDAARLLGAARRAADRGAGLTRRLLAFSRRQALEPRQIAVNDLVGGMSDLLVRTLGSAIRVETRLASGLPDVLVDPNQLENALLNLAINARDAMPSGGRLSITTDETEIAPVRDAAAEPRPGRYVTIAVSDTGDGMSEETLTRVFEPFFTTKPAGKGTGLGLSQVYGFVRQSGGHVTVESELARGTTVALYLPRCPVAATAATA